MKRVIGILALLLSAALGWMAAAFPPEAPVRIGGDRQLFVDDALVERMSGVSLKLHEPVLREVVLPMERPWEGPTSWCSVVLQDGSRFRLWYRVAPYTDTRQQRETEWWNYTAYAESRDGVVWERPSLGLYEFEGSTDNNLVWKGPGGNMSVLKDERPGVPAKERYKAITRTGQGALGLISPDGLNWSLLQEEPILSGGAFDSHNVIFIDPWTQEIVYYGRGFIHRLTGQEWVRGRDAREHMVRRIRRATSRDFRNWSSLEFIDLGRDPLDELYTNAAVPYPRAGRLYLMFPKRFLADRTFHPDWPQEGLSDIVFASSRDGVRWNRTFQEAFIRPGPDPDNWHERAIAMGQGFLQTGPAELSMYYFEHFRTDRCRLRRCTLRLDGFASVHAPQRGGEFVTKPLVFEGQHLWINYSTSAAGSIRVEIQDAAGSPLAGYALDDAAEIFGDEIERRVGWRGTAGLKSLQGRPVRLRFVLKDADLYSFYFGDR